MSPELIIILLNLVLIVLSYQVLYPRLVGNSINKLLTNDTMATLVALMVSASMYAGSGRVFSLLFFNVNWFWFTLISYSFMELPVAMRYMRRNGMMGNGL
jgi:hypothetical protein